MRRYLYLYFTLAAVDPAAFAQTTPQDQSALPASRQQQAPVAAATPADAKNLTNECRRRSIPRSQLRAATLVGVRRRLKRWSMRLTLAT